jgi:hypothetical protein
MPASMKAQRAALLGGSRCIRTGYRKYPFQHERVLRRVEQSVAVVNAEMSDDSVVDAQGTA